MTPFRKIFESYDKNLNFKFKNPELWEKLNTKTKEWEELYTKYLPDDVTNNETISENEELIRQSIQAEIDNFQNNIFQENPNSENLQLRAQEQMNKLSEELGKPSFDNFSPMQSAFFSYLLMSDQISSIFSDNPSEDDPLDIRSPKDIESIRAELEQIVNEASLISTDEPREVLTEPIMKDNIYENPLDDIEVNNENLGDESSFINENTEIDSSVEDLNIVENIENSVEPTENINSIDFNPPIDTGISNDNYFEPPVVDNIQFDGGF